MLGILAISGEGEVNGPYIAEERVMFGVYAHAMSQLTIAKIRKIFNKVDSRTIAKQVGIFHFTIFRKVCLKRKKKFESK